jgi:hypothetical protein
MNLYEYLMHQSKTLTGACTHCGAPIEFPAENIGQTALCLHCRQQTELLLAVPPSEPLVPRKALIWMAVGIGFMALCLVAAIFGKRYMQSWVDEHQPASSVASPASSSH